MVGKFKGRVCIRVSVRTVKCCVQKYLNAQKPE